MRPLLLALLLLWSFSASSQITQINIPEAKARRIIDSLWVLPKVRQEAAKWRSSSQHFRTSADSARWTLTLTRQVLDSQEQRLIIKDKLLTSKDLEVDWWKKVARRRGFLNYVLAAVGAGLGYLAIK